MIALLDHHDGNPTIICGKRIINGCQDFEIEKADNVCEVWGVSEEHIASMRAAYEKEQRGEGLPLDCFVDHDDYQVRCVVAEYGTDEHHAVLMHDSVALVRVSVASVCSDDRRYELLQDPKALVRRMVARKGTPGQQKWLIRDASNLVRHALVERGSELILSMLTQDREASVRRAVAARATRDSTMEILSKDENESVRLCVARNCSLELAEHMMGSDKKHAVRSIARQRYTALRAASTGADSGRNKRGSRDND